jgi:hypothetical protein
MENLIKKVYDDLHAKVEWNKLTHSVMCEMYSALLNKDIREFTERLAEVGEQLPPPYRVRVEAQIEAYILVVVDLTEKAIELFLAEGFTKQQQAEYYPKEMGYWGEDLEDYNDDDWEEGA